MTVDREGGGSSELELAPSSPRNIPCVHKPFPSPGLSLYRMPWSSSLKPNRIAAISPSDESPDESQGTREAGVMIGVMLEPTEEGVPQGGPLSEHPSVMRIVEASPAEIDVVLRVERLAFSRDDEPHLVSALLRDQTAQPSLSLLAYEGEWPVGHILFTKVALVGSSRSVPSAILAPLAVVPESQRQGVGRALIERGASVLAGCDVQLLFVLGDPAYYTRCGFVPATPYGLHAVPHSS